MALREKSRADTSSDPVAPPLLAVARGSLAVVAAAVVVGLLAGQVVLLAVSALDSRSGVDSWVNLVFTGVAVGVGSFLLGRGVGAPSVLHVAVGLAGPLLLGATFAFVAPSGAVAITVVVAYAVLGAAGMLRGESARRATA